MRLAIIGSSSRGNCYLLENETECLIIECGVKIMDIKKALGFSFTKVVGALVTHEHGDHACSINEVMRFGVNVYTSRGTMRALGLKIDNHRLHTIRAGEVFQLGAFKIMPFNVKHDVAEPLGFIINHQETGSVLFITDSYYVEDTFKNINNVIIEANFSHEIVKQRMAGGYLPDFRARRLFTSHMSLETCESTLKANDLSKVNNIVLIHLSDGNSDALHFQKRIEGVTGKTVHIADAGMIIENFNKRPF